MVGDTSVKLAKLKSMIGAFALGLCLQPTVGWSSRAVTAPITGTLTAAPANGSIEVDRRTYHVKANSAAAKALSSFYVGETVDIVLDGPPSALEVISIKQHPGS